jgi:PPK2 family polyphosphate:nucleotide phosphotransferase
MDFRKKFVVEPGAKFRLEKIDPAYKGEHESHQSAAAEIAHHTASLARLQYKLYAENKRSLLIVLQGLDAAGKDGVIRHVISGTNPQGVNVTCFRQPKDEELAHDFLWRAHYHTPANGEIMIFNRSHYEDVLVVRVHGVVPKSVWSRRYDRIREFETLLSDAGTHIVKFYLHISPEEQLARFKERLEDLERSWKIRDSDYTERKYWPAYIEAFEDAMRETSTARAPWYIIPSNHKWFRDLAISSILVDTLEEMDFQIPKPLVDLKAIRRQYHSAKIEQTKDGQRDLLPARPKEHNDKSVASAAKGHTPNASQVRGEVTRQNTKVIKVRTS